MDMTVGTLVRRIPQCIVTFCLTFLECSDFLTKCKLFLYFQSFLRAEIAREVEIVLLDKGSFIHHSQPWLLMGW